MESSRVGAFTNHTHSQPSSLRFKCVACFKQFSRKDTLVEHIELTRHSHHEPKCENCKKHCRCLDALREHLLGPLAKKECAAEFAERGCSLCLKFFESRNAVISHHIKCQLTASPPNLVQARSVIKRRVQAVSEQVESCLSAGGGQRNAVALDCEMVGGGQDGSFDLCARLCIVDENENILLSTYVQPQLPVTDYRFDITGILPEDLVGAMPVRMAKEAVERILYNGEKTWVNQKKAKLLVGHSLNHDLNCLGMDYPTHLQRDTAYYQPLLKTSNACNKLQYLTKTYLGYQIQEGNSHDPYEDALAAIRLYKRMKMAVHPCPKPTLKERFSFAFSSRKDLEKLSPEALIEISNPRFQCWCLDSQPVLDDCHSN